MNPIDFVRAGDTGIAFGLTKVEDATKLPVPTRAQLNKGGYHLVQTFPSFEARKTELVAKTEVAADFGLPGGTPISNLATIMPELYQAFGRKKPPAYVAIMATGGSSWGHYCSGYTLPGAKEAQVMNIMGGPKADLCNFMPLQEYFFGVERMRSGNLERGAYNQEFVAVVVWEWPDDKIAKTHAFFEELGERHKRGEARFELVKMLSKSYLSQVFGQGTEYGNCARWGSRGAVEGGLMSGSTMWPKQILVDLLESQGRTNRDNVDVIHVPWIRHAHRTKEGLPETRQYSPLASPRLRYKNLADMAGARIIVEPGSMIARVEVRSRALSSM